MGKTYEDLDAWKEATHLAVQVYQVTRAFPKDEIFGITSQIRRASLSVSSNIAEGAGRRSKKDFSHFVHMALGSLNEVESLLTICRRLDLISREHFGQLQESVEKVGRLIGGLLKYLDAYGRKAGGAAVLAKPE
jgi:four helix bundle protein